jgi:hypothetical protein
MVTHAGVTPTLAPSSAHESDDLPRLAAHGLLDLGWVALRQDEVPHPVLPRVEAGLVLAHPGFGIALLDIAPTRSADPVARLRLRLAAIGFGTTFPGRLPVIYRCLEPEDLWRLPLVLDHAFAAEPPIELSGRAWVEIVQQALLTPASEAEMAAAESWSGPAPDEAPPQEVAPEPAAPEPAPDVAETEPAKPRRSSTRVLAQVSGLAILVLGAGIGVAQYLAWADAPSAPVAEAPLRIVLHHPPGQRNAAIALAEPIRELEGPVDLRAVEGQVDAPADAVVRYFHAEDRQAAQGVRESLGPAWQLQDLTHLASSPGRGAVEIWLPPAKPPEAPALLAQAAPAPAETPVTEDESRRLASPASAGTPPAPPPAATPVQAPPQAVAEPAVPEPDAPRLPPLAGPAPGPVAETVAPAETAATMPPPDAPRAADPAPPAAAQVAPAQPAPTQPAPAPMPEAVEPLPAAAATAAEPPPPGAEPQPPSVQAEAPLPEPDLPRLEPLAAAPPAPAPSAPPASAPSPPPAAQPEPALAQPGPAPAQLEPPVAESGAVTRAAPVAPSMPVAPPAPAAASVPPPAAADPPRRPTLSPAVVAALLARGDQMLQQGDISGARLLFARAASAGSAAAATAMARSFDASVLAGLGARGIRPDAEQAAAWYRRAAELESAR